MSARPALSCVTSTRNCVSETRLVSTSAPLWLPRKFTCVVTLPLRLGSGKRYVARAEPLDVSHRRTASAIQPVVTEHDPLSDREEVWAPALVWPAYVLGARPAAAGDAPSRARTITSGARKRAKRTAMGSRADGVSSSLFADSCGVPRTGQTMRLAAQKRLVLEPMWLIGLGTQPGPPVFLVLVVGALEPDDLRIPLEREHV